MIKHLPLFKPSVLNTDDIHWMSRALKLAQLAQYDTNPNPRVGCVLIYNHQIIGQGATQAVGGHHAEIMALRQARENGITDEHLKHTIAYVTLEPCNHTGRTPPCSHALVKAQLKRVVALNLDPNPLTAGQGLLTLYQAGIEVSLMNEYISVNHNHKDINNDIHHAITDLVKEAHHLNAGFFKRMQTGLPWVRLKVASSLDGFLSLPNGHSQWLTGIESRTDTHHWRARSCAVLTGIGTLLADDPQMNVRLVKTVRSPLKIVLDTQLRTPHTARVFNDINATRPSVLLLHHADVDSTHPLNHLSGVELQRVDININTHTNTHSINNNNTKAISLNLNAVIKALGDRGLNEIHVEAGSRLNGAFLASNLIDEIVLYQAPMVLGAGLPWANIEGTDLINRPTNVNTIQRWQLHSVMPFGNDIRLVLHQPN